MKDCKHLIQLFPRGQNLKVFEPFQEHGTLSLSGAGNFSSKSFLVSDLLRENPSLKKVLWVSATDQEREHVVRSISMWGDTEVFDLVRELDKKKNLIHRMEMISLIQAPNRPAFFAVTYEDLFEPFPNWKEVSEKTIHVKKGDSHDSLSFFEQLIAGGYEASLDPYVEKGQYYRHADQLTIWPVNLDEPLRLEIAFDEIEKISVFDQVSKEDVKELKEVLIFPIKLDDHNSSLLSYFREDSLVIEDEVDIPDDQMERYEEVMKERPSVSKHLEFRSFMEETPYHHHLHYLSIFKYQNVLDFTTDLRDKVTEGWRVFLFTKHPESYENLMKEKNISFSYWKAGEIEAKERVLVIKLRHDDVFPEGFQNPSIQFALLTDRDIAGLNESEKRRTEKQRVYFDFLTGLKVGDYVVHTDHGIGQFLGLDKRTIDEVTREYLKIGYAENDKLFVPIDQADKVAKYIGGGDKAPKLTRLGSAEWNTVQSKVRKETEEIAKELLQLYAERENARGHSFTMDNDRVRLFEEKFPYEETPGQLRAIMDVKHDMERKKPMDRLVCGDVGFGKTEVAMRAAFKAVQDGKQVGVLAPITILVDQHYKSFAKRMEDFDIRIEMLSRFRSQAEQRRILKSLENGEIDIIVGTHRLLQPDVKFKDLGLVIIDEEQRFGVKQKERMKELRREVDVLTLTATPIPRTLNISLHGLRDISTITTPPPGRLPIITEVRRYSLLLIKEAIERELARGGQIYFLHNRVQTIDDMAVKLRALVPKARFIVTHGQLPPEELEQRILAFKNGQYDVLVSSTIIENGIDLPNANTLIVNQAEKFGLAQLYQLRGRVGRGRTQAYAYFLYHMKRLPLDAKKRLRAIVEASELGAGFQIAMKDLEIRGAGDILGANQSGTINVVGVSHFVRMLNQAVENLKAGRKAEKDEEESKEVTIEIPLPAYIPDDYIVSSKEKISVYQKLASADNERYLTELKAEIVDDYGKMPVEVANLFRVLEIKIYAKHARILNVKAENMHLSDDVRQIVLQMSDRVKPENIMSLLEHNSKWLISGTKLKIPFKDLGINWVSELKQSLSALSKTLKNAPGTEVKK